MLVVSACAPPQMMGALVEPENQIQAPLQPAKPMTPEGTAWLKDRCAQLVAYFDRYGGTGRSEDSDGVRNHTRIGAAVDCERGQYDKGISAMEALLERKHYDVPPATTGLARRGTIPSNSRAEPFSRDMKDKKSRPTRAALADRARVVDALIGYAARPRAGSPD